MVTRHLDTPTDGHITSSLSPERVQPIRDFVSLFAKTIHTIMLYPDTNPLPTQFREKFFQVAQEILKEEPALLLATTERAFYFHGEIVYDDDPSDTNPASVLFRDGVREIGLVSSLTEEEANELLDIFVRALSRTRGPSEIANMLWEAGIRSVHYRTVDHIIEGDQRDIDTTSDYHKTAKLFSSTVVFDEENDESTEGHDDDNDNPHGYQGLQKERYQQVNEIFRGEIQLSAKDSKALREMIAEDAACDLLHEAFRIYDEILHSKEALNISSDIVNVARRQFDSLVAEDDWSALPPLVAKIHAWRAEFADRRKISDRLGELIQHAGSAGVLTRMVNYLNKHPQTDLAPFRAYLSELEPAALGAITAMLGELEHHPARKMVYTFLGEHGDEAVDLVGNYVYDKRWYVVRNVALALGRINQPRTIAFLKKAMKHEDNRVRREALKALASLETNKSGDLLLGFLDDLDLDLRVQACKSIPADSAGAFPALEKRVNASSIVDEDSRLQKEVLAAYARCGGIRARDTLIGFIQKKKILKRQKWNQLRTNAVYALGELPPDSVHEFLTELCDQEDAAVSAPAGQVLDRLTRSETGADQP